MISPQMNSETVRVLLVEDDDDHAFLIRMAFEEQWMNVQLHHAPGAAAAVEFLCGSHHPAPDLILLDLKMPGVDGLSFLTTFKLHGHWRRIPVVVLTTSAAPEDRSLAYQHHANGYVIKPRDIQGFRTLVRDLHRYWNQINQPAGDRPPRVLPPPHPEEDRAS